MSILLIGTAGTSVLTGLPNMQEFGELVRLLIRKRSDFPNLPMDFWSVLSYTGEVSAINWTTYMPTGTCKLVPIYNANRFLRYIQPLSHGQKSLWLRSVFSLSDNTIVFFSILRRDFSSFAGGCTDSVLVVSLSLLVMQFFSAAK